MCENLTYFTPMTRDKEIYAVAGIYIREHGDNAVTEAAMRANALMDAGDLDGENVWVRVIDAIKALSLTSPSPGIALP